MVMMVFASLVHNAGESIIVSLINVGKTLAQNPGNHSCA
jgi:hypothetical protein